MRERFSLLDIPSQLDQMVLRCLAREVDQRPSSSAELQSPTTGIASVLIAAMLAGKSETRRM